MGDVQMTLDFDALAHLLSDGIAVIGAHERIVAWSDIAAEVTGIGALQALGKGLSDIFWRVEPALEFAVIPLHVTLVSRDETQRTIHAHALSIDEGWLLTFGHQQRFAQIERLKAEIVASVSHELKTPIATIKAFATTLRRNAEAMAPLQDEYLQTIESEADRLSYAVDDLLSAGRVDAEHLLRRREHVSVDSVLDSAMERLDYWSHERLTRETNGVSVDADPELLAIAFAHVIENALKFSADSAPVVITAACEDAATLVRVSDCGIGIVHEYIPYIFERFYRGDARLTAAAGGSGLGLYIARAIIRAHGGTITVESAPGAGATFTFRLPARA